MLEIVNQPAFLFLSRCFFFSQVQRTMLEIVNQLDGFEARGLASSDGGLRHTARRGASTHARVARRPRDLASSDHAVLEAAA